MSPLMVESGGMVIAVAMSSAVRITPVWVTVWVRVVFPAVMVMVAVRVSLEVFGETE